MELLREKKRQYLADTTASDKLQQQANFFGDVSKVAGAASSITSSINTIQQNRERAATKQAQSDLTAHEKEALAAVEDLRSRYGEKITSEKGQQAIRDELAKIRRKYRPEYDDERTGAAYDRLADEYTNKVIDENYLYATRAKIQRQNQERRDAEKAAANVNMYNQMATDIIAQAHNLGQAGGYKDMSSLFADTGEDIDKALKKLPLSDSEKLAAKAVLHNSAVQGQVVGALTSPDIKVVEEADLILSDPEKFKQVFGDQLAPQIEYRKNNVLKAFEDEKVMLQRDAMTSDGKSKREIEKKIANIDKQIKNLEEKDEIDGKNFTDVVLEENRIGIKKANQGRIDHILGERSLARRQEVFEQQKQFMAEGITDIFNPFTQQVLDTLATPTGKTAINQIMPGFGGLVDALKGMETKERHLSSYKPEQWKEMADSYRSYKEHMTKVSPLTESFYTTKADVNAGLFELMDSMPTDSTGNPIEFQMKTLKFLDKMASADLTETERRGYSDFVGVDVIFADNQKLKEMRELLSSGDVGVYAKGGLKGAISYPANLPLGDTRQGGGVSGARTLYDERAKQGRVPTSTSGGRAQFANDAFDKFLMKASEEYKTEAIRMLHNGATPQEVMVFRDKKINDAISDYYKTYHVVDIAALERNLEQHKPTFQNIDGIVYEFKGKDSIGLPIWYDHGVLNTNRDFHHLFEKTRMSGAPTSGIGGKVKVSDISSDMRGTNE